MVKMSIFRVRLAEEVLPTAILVMANIFSAIFAARGFSSHLALLVHRQIIIKVKISSRLWKLVSMITAKLITVQLVAKNVSLKFKLQITNKIKVVKKTVPTAKLIWSFTTAKNVTSLTQRIRSVQLSHVRFRVQSSLTQEKPKKRKKKKSGKSTWCSTKEWMRITKRKNARYASMLTHQWRTKIAVMWQCARHVSEHVI